MGVLGRLEEAVQGAEVVLEAVLEDLQVGLVVVMLVDIVNIWKKRMVCR